MPELTPLVTGSLPPRVEVFLAADELSDGTDTVTLVQISAAGSEVVRDAERVSASGGVFVTDYEVPLGVDVIYRAEQFDEDGGSLGFTVGAATRVDIALGLVVLQDPLAPKRSVTVRAEAGFASALEESRSQSTYRRGADTVVLMSELGLLENVPLRVVGETDQANSQVRDVVEQGVVLVRTMPPMPLPRLLYATIASPKWQPHNVRSGGQAFLWPLVGTQVARPRLSIIEGVVLYAQFNAFFATYVEANAAYSTYVEAKRNPPPEV